MRCTSTYHYYSRSGVMTVYRCTLDAPHTREPAWGFAAVGCHRHEESGHFWDDATSHEGVLREANRLA